MDITNNKYWNARYRDGIGSGVGSRGAFARQKEALVKKIIKKHDIQSILDVGCGDLFWIKNVQIENYIGIDFSEEVLRENMKIKPDWGFKKIDFSKETIDDHAELVICLDVLIHQSTRTKYDFVVNNLFNSTDKVMLVSGWKETPINYGSTMFFYETIYDTIQNRDVKYIDQLKYRESIILEVLK